MNDMKKSKNSIIDYLKTGTNILKSNILYVLLYWLIVSTVVVILTLPFASAVNSVYGRSDIATDIEESPLLENYLIIDLFVGHSERLLDAMSPPLLMLGFAGVLLIGVFFTGGLLERFVGGAAESVKTVKHKKTTASKPTGFFHGALRHFPAMLIILILGGLLLFLLNLVSIHLYHFFRGMVWGLTGSEALRYYIAFAGMHLIYYFLFFLIALYLQYVRIGVVATAQSSKDKQPLRIRLKNALVDAYDIFSEKKWQVIGLFFLVWLLTAVWYVLDHFVFYAALSPTAGYILLVWTIITGFIYTLLRYLSYSAAAVLFKNSK